MAEKEKQQPTVIRVRKKGRGHGGHHGGAWKVAYADFITCMFALFLVMWLLTQADLKLRQEIAQYFRQPGVLAGGSILGDDARPKEKDKPTALDAAPVVVPGTGEDTSALRGHAKELEQALVSSPELEIIKDQVHVQITAEGLEIQVVDSGAQGQRDLLFDLSSAQLKPALVALLQEIAKNLGTLPNSVEIGGHTDARKFAAGSGLDNWDLSFQRADNARRVMETNGLRPNQVLRLAAYGDAHPLNAADPLADENRRLSILARRIDSPARAGDQAEAPANATAPRPEDAPAG
jgi:chemotaxis protein MotB